MFPQEEIYAQDSLCFEGRGKRHLTRTLFPSVSFMKAESGTWDFFQSGADLIELHNPYSIHLWGEKGKYAFTYHSAGRRERSKSSDFIKNCTFLFTLMYYFIFNMLGSIAKGANISGTFFLPPVQRAIFRSHTKTFQAEWPQAAASFHCCPCPHLESGPQDLYPEHLPSSSAWASSGLQAPRAVRGQK